MDKIKLYAFEYSERSGCGCCSNSSYYSSLFTSEDEMIASLMHYPSSRYSISIFYIEAIHDGDFIFIEDTDYSDSGLYYKIQEDEAFDKIRINFATGIMRELELNGRSM